MITDRDMQRIAYEATVNPSKANALRFERALQRYRDQQRTADRKRKYATLDALTATAPRQARTA